MFLIPYGMKLGSGVSVRNYIARSMIPVLIGNTISAAFFLAGGYALCYGNPMNQQQILSFWMPLQTTAKYAFYQIKLYTAPECLFSLFLLRRAAGWQIQIQDVWKRDCPLQVLCLNGSAMLSVGSGTRECCRPVMMTQHTVTIYQMAASLVLDACQETTFFDLLLNNAKPLLSLEAAEGSHTFICNSEV